MSIFTSAKAKLAAQKLAEEQLYEFAAEEIAANNIRPGLWAPLGSSKIHIEQIRNTHLTAQHSGRPFASDSLSDA
ncbi:hypothetical protein N9N48_00125 [Luminiphilus sp.]|nr:hypothetical protein [Luminiphilus sp.]